MKQLVNNKMVSVKRLLCLLAFLVLSLGIQAETCDSTSLALMEQTWQEFRAIHPFSFQTVGLKHKGDTCVFVMSEPDNWVKEDSLRQLFRKYGGQLITRYQPYGIDGQLKDAVGCVKLDSMNFHQFESKLFILLYWTDYKPYYTDLDHPTEHVYFSEEPLDIEKVRDSLLINKNFLTQNIGGEIKGMTIRELVNSKNRVLSGVYFSEQPGFVLWVIGKDFVSVSLGNNVRRFALDSDLILGVYQDNHRIAILGRERKIPFSILPPLRSETILSLATNQEDLSLLFRSDSAKAMNDTIFATPIQMSRFLEDTELGNLMVLTDMMLKSWSENGKVNDLFIEYPQPKNYPFPNGVAHELGDSVKYLWNFNNTTRTGSLRPSYLLAKDNTSANQSHRVDSIAYEYFAKLNNTDLVRIAQYAALYNAFRGFDTNLGLKHNDSWVQTPSVTISDSPWGYGGYLLPGPKGIKIKTKVKTTRPKVKTTRPKVNVTHPVYTKQKVYTPTEAIKPSTTIGLTMPNLVSKISKILASNSRFVSCVRMDPSFYGVLKNNPSLVKVLERNKGLTNAIANNLLLKNRVVREKEFRNRLIKDSGFAREVALHPSIFVLNFNLEQIDWGEKFREGTRIAIPKEDEARGAQIGVHDKSSQKKHVLNNAELQDSRTVSTQKVNSMIELRQQMKKMGIRVKDVKWELKHTLIAFIIIYKYDKELKQAA